MSIGLTAPIALKTATASLGHHNQGTVYAKEDIKAYSHERGFELERFIDQPVFKVLNQLKGKDLLDIGCGAAPHSIYAGKIGAKKVEAYDIQPQMIEEARKAIELAGLTHRVSAKLMEDTSIDGKIQFDHVLSVNVGCNLPYNIFKQHFIHIGNALKKYGTATITAPFSLDIVFTNRKTDAKKTIAQIQETLSKLPDNLKVSEIKSILSTFKDVLSATFTISKGRLILVTDDIKLADGQPIYRKLPNCVIPNYYHSNNEYIEEIEKAGLTLVSAEKNRLESNDENLKMHNLGSTYEKHAPFIIYHVQKA